MESILKEREELDLIKERLEKTDKERESMGQNAWTLVIALFHLMASK